MQSTESDGEAPPAVTMGARILALRCRKGLKQADLARRLGITPSALWRIESGKGALARNAGRKLTIRIAAELGVSIDYLLLGTNPPAADNATDAEPIAPKAAS